MYYIIDTDFYPLDVKVMPLKKYFILSSLRKVSKRYESQNELPSSDRKAFTYQLQPTFPKAWGSQWLRKRW